GLAVADAEYFNSVTGFGVEATVGGRHVLVGRGQFLADRGVTGTEIDAVIEPLERDGHTVAGVAVDGAFVGAIGLGDELRPDAVEAVRQMRAVGMHPVLVTGDNAETARLVAERVGIDDVHAGVLPDGKADIVRRLQADGDRVAMVGDGINDAPALMQADVGIAMGGGTDIAVESADVIILRDDLGAVLTAREISRSSYRRTRHNVGLAFMFNGIGIPLAATGLIQPVWAMIAMALSVTTIFVNSLGGRPSLLFQAIGSVGRTTPAASEA
ncbi:MAG TPA: HAD-IC family P-type ATPase, partial [Nocardioides sp.]